MWLFCSFRQFLRLKNLKSLHRISLDIIEYRDLSTPEIILVIIVNPRELPDLWWRHCKTNSARTIKTKNLHNTEYTFFINTNSREGWCIFSTGQKESINYAVLFNASLKNFFWDTPSSKSLTIKNKMLVDMYKILKMTSLILWKMQKF